MFHIEYHLVTLTLLQRLEQPPNAVYGEAVRRQQQQQPRPDHPPPNHHGGNNKIYEQHNANNKLYDQHKIYDTQHTTSNKIYESHGSNNKGYEHVGNNKLYTDVGRPGSRSGITDPARFSHYVNYEEIQQHLK